MAGEIRFEWDQKKSDANLRKHGLRFPTAAQVFFDLLVEKKVQGNEHGEIRWTAIGQVGSNILHVTYTTREEGEAEIFRIISARRAAPREIRAYQGHPEDDR